MQRSQQQQQQRQQVCWCSHLKQRSMQAQRTRHGYVYSVRPLDMHTSKRRAYSSLTSTLIAGCSSHSSSNRHFLPMDAVVQSTGFQ